ncbi:MAG TPA: ferredoxin [bacterium]|nr:ferredoxin [bacterium]
MKVNINKDECIGCGSCQAMQDKLFRVGDDLVSEYIGGEEANIEEVLEAARVCPVMAIEVINDAGHKRWPEE